MISDAGKAVRFKESDVRAMGRTARGVRGIRLGEGQSVISLIVPEEGGTILTASARGFGKRTRVEEFPTKGRGTQGVIAMMCSDRNGKLAGAEQVFDGDEVMLVSDQGTLVRTSVDGVSVLGRNTQGVTLIKVDKKEKLVGVARIVDESDKTLADLDIEPVDDAGDAAADDAGTAAPDDSDA